MVLRMSMDISQILAFATIALFPNAIPSLQPSTLDMPRVASMNTFTQSSTIQYEVLSTLPLHTFTLNKDQSSSEQ